MVLQVRGGEDVPCGQVKAQPRREDSRPRVHQAQPLRLNGGRAPVEHHVMVRAQDEDVARRVGGSLWLIPKILRILLDRCDLT